MFVFKQFIFDIISCALISIVIIALGHFVRNHLKKIDSETNIELPSSFSEENILFNKDEQEPRNEQGQTFNIKEEHSRMDRDSEPEQEAGKEDESLKSNIDFDVEIEREKLNDVLEALD